MIRTDPGPFVPLFLAVLSVLLTPSCEERDEATKAAPPPQAEAPQVPAPPSEFAHFVGPEDSDMPRLETAVTSYRGPDGQTVDLISAVHIADSSHYDELNQLFTQYDALLYEMVAEEGAKPSAEEEAGGLLSFVQRGMTNMLDLAFQLDGVDYTKQNFVHADLSPDAFMALMEERGESILSLLFQAMMMDMTRAAAEAGEEREIQPFDLITAFQNREGRHALRMMFASQMTQIETIAAGFKGKDGESVLVEGRNKRALEVLDEQLALGKVKLGIYYGAAHMPDFEERLLAMGFTKTGERWLTAWDLRKRADPVAPRYRKDKK